MAALVMEIVASSQGGGAVHVRDLSLGLAGRGWKVAVVMPDDGVSSHRGALERQGIHVYPLPLASGVRWRAWWQLRRLVSAVDIVHVHGARAALFGRVAAWTLGRRRPRVIYTIHGFAAPHRRWAKRAVLLTLERLLVRATDRIIAVSEAERSAYLAHVPRAARCLAVVRNGIDAGTLTVTAERKAVRSGLGLAPEAPLIITVSRLYQPRDFGTLLDAFSRVAAATGAHLVIVGEGPYRSEIERSILRLGLTRRVRLLGLRDDVPSLLRASDAFVLATALWEGLPLTILEAMAAGLVVVASRVGGISEVVEDGVTGLLVAPGDPAELAAALLSVVRDEARREAMGLAGSRVVRERFALSRQVQETEGVYRRALE